MIRETIERYRIPGTHNINWAYDSNSNHTLNYRHITRANGYVVIEAPIFHILTALRRTFAARSDLEAFDNHSPERIIGAINYFLQGNYMDLPEIYMWGGNLGVQHGIHRQIAAAALGKTDCPYLILRSDLKHFNNLGIPYTLLCNFP